MQLRAAAFLALAVLAAAPLADARARRAIRLRTPPTVLASAAGLFDVPAPAPSCDALATRGLAHGAAQWTLSPWSPRDCAAPAGVANTGSHRVELVLVAARTAVAFTLDAGVAELVASDGRAVMVTSEGLCAPGRRTGAAVLEPGDYVLRVRDAGEGARGLEVEAMAVPARAAMVDAGATWVPMSTGASEGDAACDGDGADARVLVCPGARHVTINAPLGAVTSVESLASPRTCFTVAQGDARALTMPGGALAVVRAWPYGGERGPVYFDLR